MQSYSFLPTESRSYLAKLVQLKGKKSLYPGAGTFNCDSNGGKCEFWTDSNGRQMMKRIQDTRFSYNLNGGELSEPVASNYYPINSGKYHDTLESS